MRFVVDAQLPPRLVSYLVDREHEAVHVKDLPGGLMAPDSDIAVLADADGAVVVTKDVDFRYAHTAVGTPRAVLLIATGNISNTELFALLDQLLDEVVPAFVGADLVEVRRELLVVHGRR